MKAMWNNKIIAESNDTIVVENNHYFPENAVKKEFLKNSATHTTCPWKGEASYYTLDVDGKENKDAAWYYPDPQAGSQEYTKLYSFLERCKCNRIRA